MNILIAEHKPGGLSNSNCNIPCKRVVYQPNLSNAKLSRVNVASHVLTSQGRKEHLEVIDLYTDNLL